MKRARLSGWPAGLIGMLALTYAIERQVVRHDYKFLTQHAAQWQNTGRSVAKAAGCEVVAVGDSLLKHGLIPSQVEASLGKNRRVYNLAVPGGSSPAFYFLFRRMIDSGIKPKVVLTDGEMLGDDPLALARVWSEMITFRELADISWSARDARYFGMTALEILLPTIRARSAVRQSILAALDGKIFEEPQSLALIWRNLKKNAGAFVLRQRIDLSGPDPRPGELAQSKYLPGPFHCNPLNLSYTLRFLELARQNGIEVVWCLPPYHPDALSRRINGGWTSGYASLLKHLQERFPNLTIHSGWDAKYPPETVADITHMSRTGAIAFSDAVGHYLREKLDGEDTRRWVDLPLYDRSKAEALASSSDVEDVYESGRRLNKIMDEVRERRELAARQGSRKVRSR